MSKCFCHFNGYEVKDAKARPFKTLTELKSRTNLVDGDIVSTIGYYEPNDGGGSEYYITSVLSDTEHQEILNNGLYANLIIDKSIDIKQLGAIGNDENYASQNKEIIEKALSLCECVYISDTYYVDSVTIPSYKNVIGKSVNISKLTSKNNSIFILNNSEYVNISKLSFNNSNIGIEFKGESNAFINIDNCNFHMLVDGIKGGHEGHVNNVTITNSFFRSSSNSGINLKYGTGQINAINIKNNDISFNKYGIIFYGNNVVVENNSIQANTNHAILVNDENYDNSYNMFCFGSKITNNYFELNCSEVTENGSVIKAFGEYDTSKTNHAMFRDLIIEDNYFTENTPNIRSYIEIVTGANTYESAKATSFIIQKNNRNETIPILYTSQYSYGSKLHDANITLEQFKEVPYYIDVNTPNSLVLTNQKIDMDRYYYNDVKYVFGNHTKQNTYFIMFDDNVSDGDIQMTLSKIDVIGDTTTIYGRFIASLKGGKGPLKTLREFTSDSEGSGNVSPITYVPNKFNKPCYQVTIIPGLSSYTYTIYIEILSRVAKHISIYFDNNQSVKTTEGVPTMTPSYVGEVCFNKSNSKWYVANESNVWIEI